MSPLDNAMNASKSDLAKLTEFVNRLEERLAERAALALQLEDLDREIKNLKEEAVPEAMQAAGMKKFTTNTGREVRLKFKLDGYWPKDEEKVRSAVAWLETHNATDLIKCSVQADFNKEDRDAALKTYQELRKLNTPKAVKLVETVHQATLSKYLREQNEKEVPIPIETFNVHLGHIAEIREK